MCGSVATHMRMSLCLLFTGGADPQSQFALSKSMKLIVAGSR